MYTYKYHKDRKYIFSILKFQFFKKNFDKLRKKFINNKPDFRLAMLSFYD